MSYLNGVWFDFETRAVIHNPANGQFTSSGASKASKLTSPEHAGQFLNKIMSSHFRENTWISGQCANLAFGVSKFLESHGIPHKVEVSPNNEHVHVKVGKHIIEGSFPGPRYGTHGFKPVTPEQLKGIIRITPRRIDEVVKTLNREWKRHQ